MDAEISAVLLAQHRATIDRMIAIEGWKQKITATYFAMTSALIVAMLTAIELKLGISEPLIATGVFVVSIVWFWKILWFRQLFREEGELLGEIEKDISIRSIERKAAIRRDNRNIFTLENEIVPDIVVPLAIATLTGAWLTFSFWSGLPGFQL